MDAKYVEENLKRISEYTFTDTNLFWEMEAGEHQNDIEFLLNVIYEQNKREDLWKEMHNANIKFVQRMFDFFGNELMEAGEELRESFRKIRDEINQL